MGEKYRKLKRKKGVVREEKKGERKRRWMRLGEARAENKVWELINRERRKEVDEGVQISE